MSFILKKLPYSSKDLEPYISYKTVRYHYGKHHKGYIEKTNKLIKGTNLEKLSLEEIIKKTSKDIYKQDIFNNASQSFNHDFFWKSMSKNGGGKPNDKILELLTENYKNLNEFKKKFTEIAMARFGSGWVWLILENKSIKITSTLNGDTPIAHKQKPLITLDLWEHSYYLDYQNKRLDYVKNFLNHLINWKFLEKNLK